MIAIADYRKQKTLNAHKPYTLEVDEMGHSRRIYKELPDDSEIDALTYDPELLELAVWDRVTFDRPTYLNPDAFLDYNRDYQYQASVWEHIMRFAGIIGD